MNVIIFTFRIIFNFLSHIHFDRTIVFTYRIIHHYSSLFWEFRLISGIKPQGRVLDLLSAVVPQDIKPLVVFTLSEMSRISLKSRFVFLSMTISAIFIADLTMTLLNKYIMSYKSRIDIHIMTLIGMGIVLMLFLILIKNINRISDRAVMVFVTLGRTYFGRSIGLYLTIVALFVIIYSGYYWAWFDKNLFSEVADRVLDLFR